MDLNLSTHIIATTFSQGRAKVEHVPCTHEPSLVKKDQWRTDMVLLTMMPLVHNPTQNEHTAVVLGH
jgi:hypothetical protein